MTAIQSMQSTSPSRPCSLILMFTLQNLKYAFVTLSMFAYAHHRHKTCTDHGWTPHLNHRLNPCAHQGTDRQGTTPLRFSTPRQAFSTPSHHQHLQEASAFQEPAPEYLSAPQASAGYSGRAEPPPESLQDLELPLGIARAQLHQTYIIAQTSQSIIIVDQHAAHERITQENLKEQMQSQSIERQLLLMPEVVELTSHEVECLLEHAEDLTQLGLVIEPFDKGGVIVREVPSILGKLNLKKILVDIAEELTTMNKQTILSEKYDRLIVTMSCHYSIRAGRNMVPEEMNALLRDMETVQLSGQCAHGRPTYLEFKLNDIERLFGRK